MNKILRRLLPLLVSVLWVGYSYSESITPYYGTTGNAAINGNTWSMDTYLPADVPGLDINFIIYNYTINKDVNDQVDVYVQNENAVDGGYIFREHDEWRPGSLGGTEINKAVPIIPNIPRSYWGDGSIDVQGNGSVSDPSVVYSYKVDPCFDPQYDPNCPGYQTPVPPEIETIDVTTIYDATSGDAEIAQVDTDEVYSDEEEEKSEEEEAEEEAEEEKDREERLEKALAAAETAGMFAQSVAQAQMLAAVNAATNVTSYYNKSIPGGVYRESVVLVDTQLPENKRGLRNGLAQQLLHNKMVDMQYE